MSVLLFLMTVFLGGGTRAGFLSDVLLQILSIPFLLAALWMWVDRLSGDWSLRPADRLPRLLGLAALGVGTLIALAQIFPLFGSAGTSAFWQQITANGGVPLTTTTGSSSLDPALSRAALAALLPAAALFLLVSLLDMDARARLVSWIIWVGVASLALGVMQVLQGPTSRLRFFQYTNFLEAVGFFANRNHFAAQLYVTLPFILVWFGIKCAGQFEAPRITGQKLQWLAIAASLLLVLFAGIALSRSRAGILLSLVAFAPMILMVPTLMTLLYGRRLRLPSLRLRTALIGGALVLVVAAMGADRVLPRFEQAETADLRVLITPLSIKAAWQALPFGSGLGTFVSVFKVYEPVERMTPAFVNRAHNDWVEFTLEAGLPAILFMALFLGWFVLRAVPAWIGSPALPPRDRLISAAASLAILMLLLHSMVDYPLRTATMFGYFAMFCALLTPPPAPARRARTVFA